ncbi:hypothetical protein [Radiobacillus deserti]|uniref:Uncharacterized protein n=1 Tax=Radiobacillus deserti TaxID=2594883 RepID=A0A516KFQ2_9BACI|nr:hypothetical protein [Radiobacillus deserti]QDP40233.1 hypothetical protein FN924_08630 [Radiobacillus deserti]
MLMNLVWIIIIGVVFWALLLLDKRRRKKRENGYKPTQLSKEAKMEQERANSYRNGPPSGGGIG